MRGRPEIRRRFPRRRSLAARLRRHPVLYWIAAVALIALTAQALAQTFARAERARQRWGETRTVWVATRRLDIGMVVAANDVDSRAWPLALLPEGAINTALGDEVVGRTVVGGIEPGEVVVGSRLAPGGVHGVAALVPLGWRAVAVPFGPAPLPLAVGNRVDLVAAVDPNQSDVVLAPGGIVVAVDDRSVTVAVPADDAPKVALAVATGAVVPALRSG